MMTKIFFALVAATVLVVAMKILPSTTIGQPGPDRVAAARERIGVLVKSNVEQAGLKYPVRDLLFRAFKKEGELEIWGRDTKKGEFKRIALYPILAASGIAGPKRREGDYQVPEGFYHIDRYNPKSSFHLSLGLNYPNSEDKKLADPERPGSDIFIHGSTVTVGCLPMGDPAIEEIYVLAWDSHKAGNKVRVHLFPCRFTEENWAKYLRPFAAIWGRPDLLIFWKRLEARQIRLPEIRPVQNPAPSDSNQAP